MSMKEGFLGYGYGFDLLAIGGVCLALYAYWRLTQPRDTSDFGPVDNFGRPVDGSPSHSPFL